MMLNKPLRLLLVTFLLFALSGCAVKFIYNQLDWLIPWYLDDYVSLDPLQELQFDAQLESYLNWHRRQQLPVYAEFLDWVADAAKDGLDPGEIEQIQLRSEGFTGQLFARLGPSLATLFETLTQEQIDEMYASFVRENEEYRKKYIEEKEVKQRYKRAKDVRKFVQRWTGPLEDDQQDKISQWSKRYKLMGEEFLLSRQNWQLRLKDALEQRHDGDRFERMLTDLFANRGLGRPDQFKQKLDYNQQLLKQLYLDLDRSLNADQRRYLINKLHAYAEDFRELSEQ